MKPSVAAVSSLMRALIEVLPCESVGTHDRIYCGRIVVDDRCDELGQSIRLSGVERGSGGGHAGLPEYKWVHNIKWIIDLNWVCIALANPPEIFRNFARSVTRIRGVQARRQSRPLGLPWRDSGGINRFCGVLRAVFRKCVLKLIPLAR